MAAAALARASGVSRQTIYAIEAGDYLPNTAVALRLANALESRVEDLFRLDATPPPPRRAARADLIGAGDLFEGSPVELCRVDGRLVGVPAAPAPWQILPAGGLLLKPPGTPCPSADRSNSCARRRTPRTPAAVCCWPDATRPPRCWPAAWSAPASAW
jgi:DNA-binding XRE family transcriptional regulator